MEYEGNRNGRNEDECERRDWQWQVRLKSEQNSVGTDLHCAISSSCVDSKLSCGQHRLSSLFGTPGTKFSTFPRYLYSQCLFPADTLFLNALFFCSVPKTLKCKFRCKLAGKCLIGLSPQSDYSTSNSPHLSRREGKSIIVALLPSLAIFNGASPS